MLHGGCRRRRSNGVSQHAPRNFPTYSVPEDYHQGMTAKKAPATSTKNFPIVCVGGSAGGLDAYIRLLQNLPADMGVAIVIVNHITTLPTQLHTVLPRFTSMPVTLITDDLSIEPNHVFIIPSNRDLHVEDGEFQLKPISKPRGWPDVITVFLRSLTECWDGKLIAGLWVWENNQTLIVVSGTLARASCARPSVCLRVIASTGLRQISERLWLWPPLQPCRRIHVSRHRRFCARP